MTERGLKNINVFIQRLQTFFLFLSRFLRFLTFFIFFLERFYICAGNCGLELWRTCKACLNCVRVNCEHDCDSKNCCLSSSNYYYLYFFIPVYSTLSISDANVWSKVGLGWVVKIISQFKAQTLSDWVMSPGQKRPGRVGSRVVSVVKRSDPVPSLSGGQRIQSVIL